MIKNLLRMNELLLFIIKYECWGVNSSLQNMKKKKYTVHVPQDLKTYKSTIEKNAFLHQHLFKRAKSINVNTPWTIWDVLQNELTIDWLVDTGKAAMRHKGTCRSHVYYTHQVWLNVHTIIWIWILNHFCFGKMKLIITVFIYR